MSLASYGIENFCTIVLSFRLFGGSDWNQDHQVPSVSNQQDPSNQSPTQSTSSSDGTNTSGSFGSPSDGDFDSEELDIMSAIFLDRASANLDIFDADVKEALNEAIKTLRTVTARYTPKKRSTSKDPVKVAHILITNINTLLELLNNKAIKDVLGELATEGAKASLIELLNKLRCVKRKKKKRKKDGEDIWKNLFTKKLDKLHLNSNSYFI